MSLSLDEGGVMFSCWLPGHPSVRQSAGLKNEWLNDVRLIWSYQCDHQMNLLHFGIDSNKIKVTPFILRSKSEMTKLGLRRGYPIT